MPKYLPDFLTKEEAKEPGVLSDEVIDKMVRQEAKRFYRKCYNRLERENIELEDIFQLMKWYAQITEYDTNEPKIKSLTYIRKTIRWQAVNYLVGSRKQQVPTKTLIIKKANGDYEDYDPEDKTTSNISVIEGERVDYKVILNYLFEYCNNNAQANVRIKTKELLQIALDCNFNTIEMAERTGMTRQGAHQKLVKMIQDLAKLGRERFPEFIEGEPYIATYKNTKRTKVKCPMNKGLV